MTLLIQNSAGSLIVSLERTGGTPATGLATTDVQVDLKKATDSFFVNKALTAPVLATASIGAGANGTVNLSVLGGAVGNLYTVEVTVPGLTAPLTVTKSGTVLEVALSVVGGVPVGAENTAALVADAINALGGEIQATATGTGADSLSNAEGPTAFLGGVDGDFTELGGGSYELDLTAAETDTLGQLFVRVSGASIRTIVQSATVATATPATPTPDLTIPTTAVFGYVRDASGTAVPNASVTFRVLSVPTVLHPTTEGLVLSTRVITVKTDSTGFFTADLVTGAAIDVIISAANYRRTFVVPSVSSNLFNIV